MITLARVRLVFWHFFDEVLVEIGERCLLAGDNGSGKSTIVDAIQYAMAADLRKAHFNAAAGDRKGGRDLAGYVRCKLGSETTEYLRGDSVAHIMLEFTDGGDGFTAGVCIEAFTDGRTTEHFWLASALKAESVFVRTESNIPYSFRQFRDTLLPRGAQIFDSKKQYLRDFTAKLGVWRRMADYNPYLEAFTRSVSFTPLLSVDKFVCDYILEDRPVDISTMKANLESYKEAEREAHAAIRRIEALKKIVATAEEWRNFRKLIVLQEFLKLRVERDLEGEQCRYLESEQRGHNAIAAELEKTLSDTGVRKFEFERERSETEAALARNDAHLLYVRTEEKISRLSLELAAVQVKVERFKTIHSQCESLLGRKLEADLEKESRTMEEGEHKARGQKDEAERTRLEAERNLREVLGELADLERGIPRYPDAPTRLRAALEKKGIAAHILADLAEVTDPEWVNATEGWLNTLRFAVLVEPERFQEALEVYDSLPREIAGASLPNLSRMRDAKKREGSLALLVETESPYARMYLDFILGEVMTSDIANLKNYVKSVTRECMTYSNHTASRIREDVYRQSFLGQGARIRRKEFLALESGRLKNERDEAALRVSSAASAEETCRRVFRSLLELFHLQPSLAEEAGLKAARIAAEAELEEIDTEGFRELEERKQTLDSKIAETDRSIRDLSRKAGETAKALEVACASLEKTRGFLSSREKALGVFTESHEDVMAECEAYAEERLRLSNLRDLASNYEAAAKGIITRSEKALKQYHLLVQEYDKEFNALISFEPSETREVEQLLERLETSELPAYREKISAARKDAEREFKDHFIARLAEFIEEARESFREINDTLKIMIFGRDQYRFTLEERSDRRGQIEIVRKAAEIAEFEDGLFAQFTDASEKEAAQALFDRILRSDLDSPELRSICDYRTYFNYDIKIRDTESADPITGKPLESSLSKVLREKSGGEAQTPYYVAIAASFYRFFKNKTDTTVRLVLFDEAFNRMDDERIGKILEFYRQMGLQIVTAVPTEKIEAIAPHMDRVNLVIRHGYSAFVRDFRREGNDL